jgi:hypothetical protein
MLELYPVLKGEIDRGLQSVRVNGKTVLESQSQTSTRIMIGVGTVMALAGVAMVVGGLAIVRRNNILAARIATMQRDGSILPPEDVWQMDVDSPMLKTMKFLEVSVL